MENFIVIIAWIALIVSLAVLIFTSVAIFLKLKEPKTRSEMTSGAESESSDSDISGLASDSIFPKNESTVFFQNEPVGFAQNMETVFTQDEPTEHTLPNSE